VKSAAKPLTRDEARRIAVKVNLFSFAHTASRQLVQRHKANQQRGYENDRENCQSNICDFRTTHRPDPS
jgi:hypothetical protein